MDGTVKTGWSWFLIYIPKGLFVSSLAVQVYSCWWSFPLHAHIFTSSAVHHLTNELVLLSSLMKSHAPLPHTDHQVGDYAVVAVLY